MINNLFTKLAVITGRTAVLAGCMALSIFIYLNIFEKISLIDLPYINSVSKTSIPNLIYQVKNSENKLSNEEKLGFFGNPITLRVPIHDFSINIGEEKKITANDWIVSNQVLSLHTFSPSQGGNIGNSVIFAAEKSGQLAILDILVNGDRIVLDTDSGWRYSYRVSRRITVPKNEEYLMVKAATPQIVLLRDKNNGEVTLVEAQFLSVEKRSVI